MRKVFLTALAMALVSAGAHAQEVKVKKEDDKLKAKTASMKDRDMKMKMNAGKNIVYPYQAEYSSQFMFGAPENAKIILDLWKDWDNNTMQRNAGFLADTVVFELPSGQVIRGKQDFIQQSQQERDKFTAVKSTVEAWMPLKSIDRNENWVAVWGYEQDTDKSGKVTTQRLHEIWGFNKDGKISYIRQYASEMPRQ